jgi:hypothetical protein
MPEHGFHAVLRKLKIDAIVPPELKQFADRYLSIEIFKKWEEIEELAIGDIP